MTKKLSQRPDSTGLIRSYLPGDGSLLHATLSGHEVRLMPEWVRKFTKAPGSMATASLSKDLMDALEIPEATYLPAQQFVRDYGDNLVKEWGQCLLIGGASDPIARRILAAGVMNEVLRVYHHRADVSLAWLLPRSFESLHIGYDQNKMSSLFGNFTHAKLAVFDNLNASMHDNLRSVEEVITTRLAHSLPSVFVMNESPVFSFDLAAELGAKHHLRSIFPSENL